MRVHARPSSCARGDLPIPSARRRCATAEIVMPRERAMRVSVSIPRRAITSRFQGRRLFGLGNGRPQAYGSLPQTANTEREVFLLQWGHRLSSTERTPAAGRRSPTTCFNGAVDREEEAVTQIEYDYQVLQWGRRPSSTETKRPQLSEAPALTLQWGRPAFVDGDFPDTSIPGQGTWASVGPSTFVDGWSCDDGRRRAASMEPSAFVDGDAIHRV